MLGGKRCQKDYSVEGPRQCMRKKRHCPFAVDREEIGSNNKMKPGVIAWR